METFQGQIEECCRKTSGNECKFTDNYICDGSGLSISLHGCETGLEAARNAVRSEAQLPEQPSSSSGVPFTDSELARCRGPVLTRHYSQAGIPIAAPQVWERSPFATRGGATTVEDELERCPWLVRCQFAHDNDGFGVRVQNHLSGAVAILPQAFQALPTAPGEAASGRDRRAKFGNRMDSVKKLTDEKIVDQLGEILREFEKLTELAGEELASAIDRAKSIEKLTKEQALDRAAELVTVMATKELAFKQAFEKFKEKLTTAQAFDCAMGLSQLVTTTELFFKLAAFAFPFCEG